MHKNRTAAKVDANQPETVKTLRQIPGVTVETGHDDFLVGYCGFTLWVEWKDKEALSKKTGEVLESKIEDSQKKIRENFTGHYLITGNLDDIVQVLNRFKQWSQCLYQNGFLQCH